MSEKGVRRPESSTIPDSPGCYLFRDEQGRAVYVGKAKSLRKRLANYWADPASMHPRTVSMLEAAHDVEWIVTATEVSSLHLEYTLIRENRPRFNIRYRDDKSYPSLAVSWEEEFPRAMVMRGPRRKGVRYFGPYAHAFAIRETLDLLLRTFPVRTCSQGVFDRAHRAGRPCLLYDIAKCSGPCVGKVSADEHRRVMENLCAFLDGRTEPVVKRLETGMREAAAREEFEAAARLRDQLSSVRTAVQKQVVVGDPSAWFDVVALAEDEIEAAVQVFFVRRGRVSGRKGFVVDKVEQLGDEDLLAGFVRDLYMDAEDVPPAILLPALPTDHEVLEEWLAGRRGGRVAFRVPVRGEKRALLETVTENAKEAFAQHKLRRRKDFEARAKALRALQDELGLAEAPLRIECYDISNTGPVEIVGSMVVFEDGLPKRSDYRRFKIRGVQGQDDPASMAEVIRRRFTHVAAEREATPAKAKFAYQPNLVVVDGGKGQLAAAIGALAEAGVAGVSVVSLAKRFEEVFVPGREEPVVIERGSDALYLLQHVRDEAHRFAIAYHRKRRDARAVASPLDEVPGIGPQRKRDLLRRFGSVRRILQASEEELAEVVPASAARRLLGVLRGLEPGRANEG